MNKFLIINPSGIGDAWIMSSGFTKIAKLLFGVKVNDITICDSIKQG